ncbi:MAG: hypothetical protein Q9165_006523 [Trypethelium subeluteriae]
MSNRRVKDIAYEADDVEDYDDDEDYAQDEGLSPEDQEQMRQGKTKVREALGTAYSIPDREIEDALWNYYYDISKTVSYLKNQFQPVRPKQQKQPSRFDQAVAAVQAPQAKKSDTPWLNVPRHLQAEIIVEPLFPRGGLLGGSSGGKKPSKLAQLAAARKKKEEEKKAQEIAPQFFQSSSNALSLLDRLEGRVTPSKPFTKGTSPSESGQQAVGGQHAEATETQPPPQNINREPESRQSESEITIESTNRETLRAAPSSFALTMTGLYATAGQSSSIWRPEPTSTFPILGYNKKHTTEANRAFLGPSPDDIVEQAQTKGKKGNTEKHGKKTEESAGGAVQAIADLSVQDAPKVKSKNIDVIAEFKKSNMKNTASFVVVGHIDHGKSTLMGRLLLDLHVISPRTIDKLRQEASTIGKSSFALAWVMDQTSDERSRGVTVDVATHAFETDKTRFTILDAPGHRDFVPSMIAGASQADFAILVLDAGPDGFESGLRGQTKEHALLLRALGVARVVVAVNKMDAVAWDQARFDDVQQQMRAFFVTAGFAAANLTFVPCAGLTGENVLRAVPKEMADWYEGPTLVEALEDAEPAERSLEKPLRMSVADVFRGGVTNPLSITGRIDAGTLQVGDQILVQPAGETAVIKGIEVDDEAETSADWAVAGMLPVLHLAEIDPVHLRVGDVVCNPTKSPIRNVKVLEVKILAFEHVLPQLVDVHRGRMHVPGRVSELLALLDAKTGLEGKKKRPRVVQPGSMAKVRVELEKALPLEMPGRVVLRAEGKTIAAGLIDAVIG